MFEEWSFETEILFGWGFLRVCCEYLGDGISNFLVENVSEIVRYYPLKRGELWRGRELFPNTYGATQSCPFNPMLSRHDTDLRNPLLRYLCVA
jgi:hypothetical protein